MPNLYPTINLPTLVSPRSQATEKKYRLAPKFDFERGEFLFDGAGRIIIADGKETFEQWCLKTCMTARGSRLAYSDKIGTEFFSATKEPDPAAVRSAIIRTITETILVNPAAEYVKDFEFDGSGDELHVSFSVKGRNWAEASRLTLTY